MYSYRTVWYAVDLNNILLTHFLVYVVETDAVHTWYRGTNLPLSTVEFTSRPPRAAAGRKLQYVGSIFWRYPSYFQNTRPSNGAPRSLEGQTRENNLQITDNHDQRPPTSCIYRQRLH
jgi:hypothetical protein